VAAGELSSQAEQIETRSAGSGNRPGFFYWRAYGDEEDCGEEEDGLDDAPQGSLSEEGERAGPEGTSGETS
jgi:hypothetical protein